MKWSLRIKTAIAFHQDSHFFFFFVFWIEQLYAKTYVIGLLFHSYLVFILHDIKQLQWVWACNNYYILSLFLPFWRITIVLYWKSSLQMKTKDFFKVPEVQHNRGYQSKISLLLRMAQKSVGWQKNWTSIFWPSV